MKFPIQVACLVCVCSRSLCVTSIVTAVLTVGSMNLEADRNCSPHSVKNPNKMSYV